MMKMLQVPQIKTVIPLNNGVFTHMDYDFEFITASQLDMMFGVNYGERPISPVIDRLVENHNSISNEELDKISELVLSIHKKKWDRYLDIYKLEYDNIHNYLDEYTESIDITETEEGSTTGNVTSNGTDSVKTTDVRTDNLTKNGTYNSNSQETGTGKDSVYGFNSDNAVDSNSNENSRNNESTDTSEVKETGTLQHDIEAEKTLSSSKETLGSTNIETSTKKERTFTHKGNIGNLTTQELIRQDIKLWEWNFIESVLTDVKDLLTLPIYL